MKYKTTTLGTENINKLLIRLSTPATVGMLVIALYNVVDTIFVGHAVGPLAIGGLTIIFPIQMLIMAIAQTVGIGGASIISRMLGAQQKEKADQTAGNLLTLIVSLSFLFLPLTYIFRVPLLIAFGAEGEILKYSLEYFSIVVWGSPFLSISMMANSVLRAEGNTHIAMYTMIIAAVINLVFDPIFILLLDLGVSGAAYATVLSQVVMTIYIGWFFITGRSSLHVNRTHLRLDKAIVLETFAIGAASFARQVSGSLIATLLNHSLRIYGGPMALSAFGMMNRVLMLMFMPIFGIAQGFLPISGYNYGAKNYGRVIQSLWAATKIASLFSIIGFLWFVMFPRTTLTLFSTDKELLDIGENALRWIVFALPLVGFQVIGASLFQAMGKAVPSFFLSLSRQVLFFLPLMFFLPLWLGIDGIWLSFPIADTLAFIVTLTMVLPQMRKLQQAEHNEQASKVV